MIYVCYLCTKIQDFMKKTLFISTFMLLGFSLVFAQNPTKPFKGRFDKRDDKLSFVVSDIVEPSELEPLAVQRFNIRIKANVEINRMTMKELMEVMIQNEGSVPVSLFISDIPGEELKLKSTSSVQYSQNLYNEIKALNVVEKAWVS